MTIITHEKILEIIRGLVKEEGSQVKAADRLDISTAYLNDILNGRRDVSDAVARRLPPHGYRRVVLFERITEEEKS